jgi:hypothetical protein
MAAAPGRGRTSKALLALASLPTRLVVIRAQMQLPTSRVYPRMQ